MSRLIRQLLFMFGPMILSKVTRMFRNRNRGNQGYDDRRHPQDRRQRPQRRQQQGDNYRDEHVRPQRRSNRQQPPPVVDIEPKLSEEEENFRLKDEDIMLEQTDLKYVADDKLDLRQAEPETLESEDYFEEGNS